MTIMKSALLGSAAVLVAAVSAQAADLPSKKAAPATYVKICDAYGAGFFYIPGTDTCVKLGGYVRAEYQYVPAQNTYDRSGALQTASVASSSTPKNLQDTTGYEVRGRIDVDARTPTAMGVARTFIRLRGANTSGIRNTAITTTGYNMSTASTSGITVESASVQWAGFTFGIAPENYSMMPSHFYNANPWSGFPNGMKQIAYTANFGGGITATVALEDRRDHGYGGNTVHTASAGTDVVANLRLDQSWGFAAVHGLWGNNSYYTGTTGLPIISGTDFAGVGSTGAVDTKNKSSYAIGATVNYKLPMIAAGDQVWFTANYADGALGMLLSDGGLSNVNSPANKRLMGGLVRVDANLVPTNTGTAAAVGNVKGWNVAGAFTHYWAAQWRSNLSAGYIEFNPPTQGQTTAMAWGKGQLQVYTGSLIYSPAKDLDIGLELQYASLKNKVQNASSNFVAAGSPGLSENNISTKLRVERSF